jgi:CHAT domain-containing protein/HEPN domain-containing protein
MRRALRWLAVVVLCWTASAAAGEPSPDARLREARTAYDEAITLVRAGKYAEAVVRCEQAVMLREAVLGGSQPPVAEALNLLGELHRLRGHFDRAEPLLQRGLAIREATLGKSHPDVASSLVHLGLLHQSRGLYGQAGQLFQRALAIQEAALDKNPFEVAVTLNNLALVYQVQGLFSRAEPLYLRAHAILETAVDESHPFLAQSRHNLAILYQLQGQFSRAEPIYVRSHALQEAALGENHPHLAVSLNDLASLYQAQGLFSRAEPLYLRSLAIQEAALGKHHPGLANPLTNLAQLYQAQGLFSRAEPLHVRGLAIREAALGKNHPDVAKSLHGLALLYQAMGLYRRAEPLYVRAVTLVEAALGRNHLDVAQSLNNLAALYQSQGLYSRAEPLHVRAHAIREAALGRNHPHVAESLSNLAITYQGQGQHSRAERLHLRAQVIQEAALGKHHPDVARTLSNLAVSYQGRGLYSQAEPLFLRALAIEEAALGKHHPSLAMTLNNLALMYQAQRLYDRAEPLYLRALAIQEAALGKGHPGLSDLLRNLASLRLAQQRHDAAVPLFARAFAISEQRLRQEAVTFSEARLAGFLQFLRDLEEHLYALLRAHPGDPGVRRLALSTTLLLKGRSVEETAGISRAVYQSLGPEERETFERLRGLRTRLASLWLQGPGSLPPAAYQQQLKDLTAQGDALEASLASRSAPLRALAALPSPADIVDRVAQTLPEDGALIELITYQDRPLVPGSGAPRSHLRYQALVLFPDATIRTLDLGPAEPIDSAASRLRDALANREAGFQPHAQALHQLAFQPLLPLLGKARRLYLSPDGQLSLVPFAALHDGQRFLVDSFDFTYLTSGKDLLPRPQQPVSATSVVVLADPDFHAPALSVAMAPVPAERSASLQHFFSTRREELTLRDWNLVPLPGTRGEAEAIQRLLPQAQLFLGAEATKQRLLQLPTPGLLHLATHGFFLKDEAAPAGSRAVASFGTLGERSQAPLPPDPLLRSGLLFAGANASSASTAQPPPESALATALELAGLNLWGTQLVVLSACDTGRGDVRLGQGVHGLRRALVVAGAETVVMSLWKVNDDTTRQLMEAYYQKLLAGHGRATALREAMLWLRATHPHPHTWAPFIALGQDAPLRELRPGP